MGFENISKLNNEGVPETENEKNKEAQIAEGMEINNEKSGDERKEKGMSRRKFLKTFGMVAAGVAAGLTPDLGEAKKSSRKDLEKQAWADFEQYDAILEDRDHEGVYIRKDIDREQEVIAEEDVKSIKEVLDYHKEGKIKINLQTIEAIKNNWIKKYEEDPKFKKSLDDAYSEMDTWIEELKKQFEKYGLDGDLAYLAIPESHWQIKAKSRAGAVGPYQIIPSTARTYKLKTGYYKDEAGCADERTDPIKSADACARILKDLLKDFKGDRDLALSGYNGSFVYKYKKQVRGRGMSYQGFLRFLEDRINKEKESLQSSKYYSHKIKRGDTLGRICRKYGVGMNELCQVNNITSRDKININQKIIIPLNEEIKERTFNKAVAGFAENLVYPAKYDAVMSHINRKIVAKIKN